MAQENLRDRQLHNQGTFVLFLPHTNLPVAGSADYRLLRNMTTNKNSDSITGIAMPPSAHKINEKNIIASSVVPENLLHSHIPSRTVHSIL